MLQNAALAFVTICPDRGSSAHVQIHVVMLPNDKVIPLNDMVSYWSQPFNCACIHFKTNLIKSDKFHQTPRNLLKFGHNLPIFSPFNQKVKKNLGG